MKKTFFIMKKSLRESRRNRVKSIFMLLFPIVMAIILGYTVLPTQITLNDNDPVLIDFSTNDIKFYLPILNDHEAFSEAAETLAKSINRRFLNLRYNFRNTEDLKQYLNSNSNLIFKNAVEFIEDKANPSNFDFIVYDSKLEASANDLKDSFNSNIISFDKNYELYTLLTKFKIQKLVKPASENPNITFTFAMQSNQELDFNLAKMFVSFMMSITFMPGLMNVFLKLMNDKEKKIRFLLRRQGVSIYQYQASYILLHAFQTILSVIVVTFILKTKIFVNTSFFMIFIPLFIYNLSLGSFSLFFSQLAPDIRSGQIAISVLFVGVSMLSALINSSIVPNWIKYMMFILPQISLASIMEKLLAKFSDPYGLELSDLFRNYKGSSFFLNIVILIINFVAYYAISHYIYTNQTTETESNVRANDNEIMTISKSDYFEEVRNLELIEQSKNQRSLRIDSIVKSYEGKETPAVNNVSLELYENQIFVLLGQNGAGKSSLINVISGENLPDSGSIRLHDINLLNNKDYLFSNLGLTGQEDIYFDQLSVIENLQSMSEIKTLSFDEGQILKLLKELDMEDQSETIASQLSGGQKRKLCIAMSVVGDSKFILLDEPTSGVDITSRRQLWKFLKNIKKNKILLLTTHSLDEAEALADRIGIMKDGVLECCGSSAFLKEKYECGFNVNTIFNDRSSSTIKDKIEQHVLSQFTESQVKLKSKDLYSFNFPSKYKSEAKQIFDIFNEYKTNGQLMNYTVSSTTLEDVFLKLNAEAMGKELNQASEDHSLIKKNSVCDVNGSLKDSLIVSGSKDYRSSFITQITEGIYRHLLCLSRRKLLYLAEIMSCTLIMIFFYLFSNLIFSVKIQSLDTYSILSTTDKIVVAFNPNLNNFDPASFLADHKGVRFEFVKPNRELSFDQFNDFIKNYSPRHDVRGAIYFETITVSSFATYIISAKSELYNAGLFSIVTSSIIKNKMSYPTILQPFNSIDTLPESISFFSQIQKYSAISAVMIIFVVTSIFSFASYSVIYPLKERKYNTKHLLFLTGRSKMHYWLSFFIADVIKFVPVHIVVFTLIGITITNPATMIFVGIVLTFITILIGYVFSFFLDTEEDSQKHFILLNYLTLVTIVPLIYKNYLNFTYISPLAHAFYFSFKLIMNQLYKSIRNDNDQVTDTTVYFLVSAVHIAILIGILAAFEKGYFERCAFSSKLLKRRPENKYIDEQISNADSSVCTVRIKNLNKVYNPICCGKPCHAVNSFYLGLQNQEKFGLLGYNGGGKSSIFKLITHDISSDTGEINIFGHEVTKDFNMLSQLVSYCPQSNAHFDRMTTEENVLFFNNDSSKIERVLHKFGLLKHKNTLAMNLSGGNKRKLNFAIAMLSKKKLILLDEPSAGVDPEARRVMWKSINELDNEHTYNMILTTHSLEEAEILCDTIGWIKDGNFLKVGNAEKLKLLEMDGYNLEFRFNLAKSESIVESHQSPSFISGLSILDSAAVENRHIYNYSLRLIENALKNEVDSIALMHLIENGGVLKIKFNESKQSQIFSSILELNLRNSILNEVHLYLETLENLILKIDQENKDQVA